MFKIKLTGPNVIKRKYVVYVDDVCKGSFSNRRAADSFIALIEAEMNEAFLFINEEYSILHQLYRSYFLSDQDFKFKFRVENAFDLVNNRLNFIISKGSSLNHNPIISQAITVCLESLVEICDLIDRKSRQRYDMLTRRRITLYKKIIDQYTEAYCKFKKEASNKQLIRIKHEKRTEDYPGIESAKLKAQARSSII
ncbi:MAG TPA: hypothetical protein PK727_04730 [Bacteroidales bacterium]|nr:hypothetical protein [Bacteroidales bacterium]HOG56614.1 hypothetical protein [Bacteroidales bacterium]